MWDPSTRSATKDEFVALLSGLVRKVKSVLRRGDLARDQATATALRDTVATQVSADAMELAARFSAKEITLRQFQAELYLTTRNATIAQYALARGGLSEMVAADRAVLSSLMRAQADYLRAFVAAIASPEGLDAATIAARASLYPSEAGIEAHSRGMAATMSVDLPEHPPAHVRCRCVWTFSQEDGATVAYWRTQGDERVCAICSSLSGQYSPWRAAA